MTIAQVLQAFASVAKVQLLTECVLGARAVQKRGTVPSHTRVEFATQNMSVDDVLYFSGELGRPASRRPQYVGLIVWIPFEDYDRATRGDNPPG